MAYHFKAYGHILCLTARFCFLTFYYTVALVSNMMPISDDVIVVYGECQ